MQTRTFSFEDQDRFAALSGDANPLHVDPIYARRLLYGRAVVHGVHLLLWALDRACGELGGPLVLTTIACRFSGPVGVGEPATLTIERIGDRLSCRIRTAQGLATDVEAHISSITPERQLQVKGGCPPLLPPTALGPEAIDGASGSLDLHLDEDCFRSLFPRAALSMLPEQSAVLLATTRLVGVHCPGLNSIFSELALEFDADARRGSEGENRLGYRVSRFDDRLNLARIEVGAARTAGFIKAFYRPKPVAQPTATSLRVHVRESEFAGRSALVVGGSRGLGALTAKLLAAGGASVTLTYAQGGEEAQSVVAEIAAIGGAANKLRLDVLAPDEDIEHVVAELGPISHLYYFATVPIFVAKRGQFNAELFRRFCSVYVDGFARLVRALVPRGLRVALYPSSSAISELPIDMGEYAAAKSAGEQLCRFLEKAHPGLVALTPRLPRLPTDQTRSLLPAREEDPLPHILPELRRA